MVPIGNDTGLIVTMELAFPGIIPILFASASVNQKSPFWSSVLYREYAPGTGMVNSSIFPVAGSRRPILFARCSANHNRPRPSIVKRSEEHTSELQSHSDLVCRLLLEKKN